MRLPQLSYLALAGRQEDPGAICLPPAVDIDWTNGFNCTTMQLMQQQFSFT
jgi:hypothetical protein